MQTPLDLAVLVRLIAMSLPLLLVLAALLAPRDRPFRVAWLATAGAVLLGLPVALVGPWLPLSPDASPDALAPLTTLADVVRLDPVTSAMLVLVGTLALVIVRYSQSYLRGDGGQHRYVRALLLTLASVTTLVLCNDLLVLSLAWLGSSLALHQLLTHFRERTQALVAAHKKFLLSRLADACVLGATGLLFWAVGSVHLDAIADYATQSPSLPGPVVLATLLLVAGVTLKTAQLPFHGWLTQVMEAPTPVSALLHAGVVNIGGLVLIRLAPLMVEAPLASGALVVVGTVTAVTAALVMATRVSIKVSLAWSTAAQMGLMLVQCGLGLWHLALLHLLAHSVYKAHAFLSGGGTVDAWRIKAAAASRPATSIGASVLALALTLPAVLGICWGVDAVLPSHHAALGPLSVVLALALAPLLARSASTGLRSLAGGVALSVGIVALTFAGHLGSELLAPGPEPAALTAVLGWAFVAPAFALLFAVQIVLHARPHGWLARTLQPHLFAGLYLDALFTRMTFRIWPPRLPPRPASAPARLVPETQES